MKLRNYLNEKNTKKTSRLEQKLFDRDKCNVMNERLMNQMFETKMLTIYGCNHSMSDYKSHYASHPSFKTIYVGFLSLIAKEEAECKYYLKRSHSSFEGNTKHDGYSQSPKYI